MVGYSRRSECHLCEHPLLLTVLLPLIPIMGIESNPFQLSIALCRYQLR